MPELTPLTVPGELTSLKAIRDYVMDASTEAGLSELLTNRLRLAVDEIVTNSIVHGYQEAGIEGDITIRASLTEKSLTITVEDTGPFYDPTQHEIPTAEELGEPLDSRDIGGLGIFLAVNYMDEFHYERAGDRNRNIFVVYLTPSKDK